MPVAVAVCTTVVFAGWSRPRQKGTGGKPNAAGTVSAWPTTLLATLRLVRPPRRDSDLVHEVQRKVVPDARYLVYQGYSCRVM